jgi:hypothetical protein
MGSKLAVQAPDNALLIGQALVVLHKNLCQACFSIALGIIGFGKKNRVNQLNGEG